jgi:hypothetical protein
MPMIDVTFVRGSVDDEALSRLTDEVVTALLRAERAPDTPFLRDNPRVLDADPRNPRGQLGRRRQGHLLSPGERPCGRRHAR